VPTLELVFRAAQPPGWAGWLLAALVVLAVPGAIASRRALERGEELPPPRALYLQTGLLLLVLLGAGWLAARDLGLALGSRPPPSARAWALGGAVLSGMLVAALAVWRVTPEVERARGAAFLPRDGLERALVAAVACLAGLAEELVWRAVLPALVLHWTGNAWLAVGLSALSFGCAHAVQGRLATAVVFAVALAFQALVQAAGGLAVAVAVHALYDLLAVFWLAPYLRRRSLSSP
jgi:membrane protease YdiL (CAAX protease family)